MASQREREMRWTARDVVRVRSGVTGAAVSDEVAVEEPLEIRVNGDSVAVTMRTPGDDARLAVGFLFAEGLLRSIDDVGSVSHCGRPGEEGYGNVLDVIPAAGLSLDIERVQATRRGTLTTSACGVCGRRSVDDLLSLCGVVPEGPTLPASLLAEAPERLRGVQRVFEHTGGVHAAAAFDAAGNLLAGYEDVGRHNAVDKVVGALVHAGRVRSPRAPGYRPVPEPERPVLLAISGRASFEILQKAAVARIPVVVSVSAASSLAIDVAEQAGITLATFSRRGDFNLHTHPSRVREI
ncbi:MULTISPECIES: formate dehydrogenase accessory sulfurtransferase FdhD [Myxococcaceae]|uniref:formate dehydrogenase accessory sulfurtransferase FdhD n=1 Tax=Myxococcaceae TaxID=31 RepID=UPI001E336548|nr:MULTISPECIES: formate dehydrogenase accessory sulfurtransferase FdhD [Myxococcaceae]